MALKDLSVSEISELLEEHFEWYCENYDSGLEGIESYHELKYGASAHVKGLGHVRRVADYGGEGQGDEYWVVFSVTEGDVVRTFRKDGWYQSYNGGEFDSELVEVKPVQKTITVWE